MVLKHYDNEMYHKHFLDFTVKFHLKHIFIILISSMPTPIQ